MDVKEFENRRWKREDQALQFRHKAALALIDKGPVLDLGSGDGLLLALLKERGIAGQGLDLSEEGVAKARSKGIDAEVFDFGAKALPFPAAHFESAVMLDILEHLYDPGSVLKEAARVARGAVVVGVPNFNSLPARFQTLFGKVPENNQPKKGHVYWFNERVLLGLADEADWSSKSCMSMRSGSGCQWLVRCRAASASCGRRSSGSRSWRGSRKDMDKIKRR